MKNTTAAIALALGTVLAAGPVLAQTPLGAEATDAQPADAPAAPTDASKPANKLRIPAADESVYVVQERAYSKSGQFEITPYFNTALNPKFVGYAGFGISAAYHIQENLAIEFMTSLFQAAYYSDLVFEVYTYRQLLPDGVDLKQMVYFNALSLQFSAFYGKLEFYGYLVDYDFYVTGGLGYALTREPCDPVTPQEAAAGDTSCSTLVDVGKGLRFPDRGLDQHKITGNLGFGMRVFFHEMIGARLEMRNVAFADRTPLASNAANQNQTTTDIRNTMMLVLGISVML